MLFKEYNRLLLFLANFFSKHLMMESLSTEKENIIKDTRNILRL